MTAITDLSGNSRDGEMTDFSVEQLAGTAWTDSEPDVNDAGSYSLVLDGVANRLVVPAWELGTGTAPYTVAAWCKPFATTGVHTIFSASPGATNARSALLFWYGDDKQFALQRSDGTTYHNALGATDLPRDVWYHVIGRYDGTTMDIFVDGVKGTPQASTLSVAAAQHVNVGATVASNAVTFVGNLHIDALRVYSSALTDNQCIALSTGDDTDEDWPADDTLELHYGFERDAYSVSVDDAYEVTEGDTLTITPIVSSTYGLPSTISADSLFATVGDDLVFRPTRSQAGRVYSVTVTASDGTHTAQDTTRIAVFRNWGNLRSYNGGLPIIPHANAEWHTQLVDAPFLTADCKIGNTWFGLVQATSTTPYQFRTVGLYTSTNLKTWTPVGVVINAVPDSWCDNYLLHPTTIDIDGTKYIYMSASNNGNTQESIGLWTTTDYSTFTPYASNPVITGDPKVGCPSVIKIGETYYLYATNRDPSDIVYYTSADGIAWSYGGIALAVTDDEWTDISILLDPWVIENNGSYEMILTGHDTTTETQVLLYAVSLDGITWHRSSDVVIALATPSGQLNDAGPGDGALLLVGSAAYLYWTATTWVGTPFDSYVYCDGMLSTLYDNGDWRMSWLLIP